MPPACPSACPFSCAFSVPPFSWPRFALMCQSVHPPATFWRSRLPPSLRPPPTLPFHSPCSLAGACALGLCVPGLGMPCQVGRGPNPRTQRVPKQCGATIVWPRAQARPAGAVRLSGQGGRAHSPGCQEVSRVSASVPPGRRGAVGGVTRRRPASLRVEGRREASTCCRPSGLCRPCPVYRCIQGSVPHLAGWLQLSLPGPGRGNLGE